MDTSDPLIFFDHEGVCNHCKSYREAIPKLPCFSSKAKELLDEQISKIKKNKYPKSLSDAAKYMRNQEVPKDAWGNDFEYTSSSSCGKDYEIVSYGRDGKKGGSENDADISSCSSDDE